MRIEKFLKERQPGFHVAKISYPDIRAEDVLPYLEEHYSQDVMYLPDYIDNKVSVGAIASVLVKHLDEPFFIKMGGIMGTIFQSLVPDVEIPGDYDVYPDIDEHVVFYALKEAMNYIASVYEKDRFIWVFGRIDFSHKYRYVRFLEFLNSLDKEETHISHKCIAVGYPSNALNVLTLEADIKPMYIFDNLLSLPLKKEHKTLIGVLALVSEYASGHFTISFVARLIEQYPWTESVFSDLLRWGIVEQYNYYLYSFTNMRFFHYALNHFSGEKEQKMVLSLMRRDLRGNILYAARLNRRKGNVHKALASITLYARSLAREGRYRKAYEEIVNYYKAYKEYLSVPQMHFYLKLASSVVQPDGELTSFIISRLIQNRLWKVSTLPYMARLMPAIPENTAFWNDIMQSAYEEENTNRRNIMLLASFNYMWHAGKSTNEMIEKIEKHIYLPSVKDPYLQILLLIDYARVHVIKYNFKEAREAINLARDLVEYKRLWFVASPVYNNLFVVLYREKDYYPAARLLPLLFKAYEPALLYVDESLPTAISNYILVSGNSSKKYFSIERIAIDMLDIVNVIGDKHTKIAIYYALSFVSYEYGYKDRTIFYIDKIKELIDEAGWDNVPYKWKMNYFYVKAHFYIMEGMIEKAFETLKQWEESIGLYGEAYFIKQVLLEYIDITTGKKAPEPGKHHPLLIYRYYLDRGKITAGIEALKEAFNRARRAGDMLEMAHAKYLIGLLFGELRNIPAMLEALYDAYAMYHILESAYTAKISETLGDDLNNMPEDMIMIYVNRLMLLHLFADIAAENTIEDIMVSVLSSIVIPATGMWMFFQWENFSDFVGVSLIKGVTHKFKDFYLSPNDVDINGTYVIGTSPAYAYITVVSENARLTIYAENRYVDDVFGDADITTMRLYAENLIGLLIKMKVSEKAIVDSLTGLYSRWYILKSLENEVNRYLRSQSPLSVLFIDIDDFKKVNDTYGHDVGDMVLARVGRIIKDAIRVVDMAGRYGGEEFLVILPDTDEEGAYRVAKRIREVIEDDINMPVPITVSIGIATLRDGMSMSASDLIKLSDMAMYEAKRKGKNNIVIFRRRTL